MKKFLIIFAVLSIIGGLYLISQAPETAEVYKPVVGEDSMAWMENETLHPDDEIPEQYREKKEWIPMKVIECEEVEDEKYEITFENEYFIVSDTPSKLGDTNRCWVNTWYYSKEYPTSDSVIFSNPYQNNIDTEIK